MATAVKYALVTDVTWATWSAPEQAAYTGNVETFAEFVALLPASLITADEQWTLDCYDDWASGHTSTCALPDIPSDATRYIHITSPVGERHTGTQGSGFHIITSGSTINFSVSTDYTRIDFIDVQNTFGRSFNGINVGTNVTIDSCIIEGGSASVAVGSFQAGFTASNNLVLGGSTGIDPNAWQNPMNIYNNTVTGCTTGIGSSNGGYLHISNNIAYNNTTDYNTTYAPNANSYNNASSAGTPPGTAPVATSIVSGDFTNAAGGDYSLVSGGTPVDAGYDLSGTFTNDILNATRGATFDVGAFEYIAAGGGGAGSYVGATEVTTCYIGTVEVTTSYIGSNETGVALAPNAEGLFDPPDSVVDSAYSYATADLFTGGVPTSYSLNGTLPTGLTLNTSSGLISGTPTTAQALSNISVTATNAAGNDTTNTADITISAAPSGLYVDVDSIGGIASDAYTYAQNSLTQPFETIQRASDVALPNDTIYIREGSYEEEIDLTSSGTSGNVITYTNYPLEVPSIDGSDAVTGWSTVTSQSEAKGNANWANLYKTTITGTLDPLNTNLLQDDTILWLSQSFNPGLEPTDQFFTDNSLTFHTVANGDSTETSLVDTTNLTQTDADTYENSYCLLWVTGNRVLFNKITSFNPTTDTIYYDDGGNPPYTDRDGRYSILNGMLHLSRAGEFSVEDNGDGTTDIFVWPIGGTTAGIRRSTRRYGINLNYQNYVTIDGLKVKNMCDDTLTGGIGIGTFNNTNPVTNITIKNNAILNCKHATYGYGGLYVSNGSDITIQNNTSKNNQNNHCMFINNISDSVIEDNTLEKPGHAGIIMYGVDNVMFIGNTISNVNGSHANTITTYLSCNDVLIADNYVYSVGATITVDESSNIYYHNNIIEANSTGGCFDEWGGASANGDLNLTQNTFVKSANGVSVSMGRLANLSYTLKNNIIEGGGCYDGSPPIDNTNYTHEYNLYTDVAFWQSASSPYFWNIGTGEVIDETDIDSVYTDHANDDYSLIPTSPAKNAGVNIDASLPIAKFPDYDFTKDIEGTTRSVTTPSMGAYE